MNDASFSLLSTRYLFLTAHNCLFFPSIYCADQIAWYLSSLTLNTAVDSRVPSMVGVGRHSQATLYLLQKHLLCWQLEYTVYRNGIASVKVKFWVLLEFPFAKNCIASKKLQSPAGYEKMFLKRTENIWRCAVFPPWPAYLISPALEVIKISDENSTYVFC
jgi:hypothetical protein